MPIKEIPVNKQERRNKPVGSSRHQARVVALQALYEIDMSGHDTEVTLDRLLAEKEMAPATAAFTRELVKGAIENRGTIDDTIKRFAPAWPVSQIAPIDRNILRLAIFELLHHNITPVKVAINEAVDLAKTFGSESSYKFINGVLSSVSTLLLSQQKTP